jgi:hypothetical protein
MKTTVWLRISSVIALLFAVGHTLGGRKYWSPMGNNPVLGTMRSVRFDTMGVNRSYLDFYMGFGYSLSTTMLMQAILLWLLASLARTDAARLRPIIAVLTVATAVGGLISWQFLFPVPALFSLVLVASLAVAFAVAHEPLRATGA